MPYEKPFIYTFDADNLTNGQSYTRLQVPIQNDYAFVLRRVCGFDNVMAPATQKFQFYDAEFRRLFQAQQHMPVAWPVVPGLYYPSNSQIQFDLSPVLKAGNAYAAGGSTPNYYSQLAFQGSKIIDGARPYQTPYSYYERSYTYTSDVTMDWTGRLPAAYTALDAERMFYQPLQNVDFELLYINLLFRPTGSVTFTPASGIMKLRVLDSMDSALMTAPVVDNYINWLSQTQSNGFPSPTLVWPANGLIKYGVTSLLVENQVPGTLRVEWHGVSRLPCLGNITGGRP